MKKLVSILLILATVFCFTACQSKPSDEKIKEAFVGEFQFEKVFWGASISSNGNTKSWLNLVGKTAFKFDGEKWDGIYDAEIIDIVLITDEEKKALQGQDDNNNKAPDVSKYKYIYKVFINSKEGNVTRQHIYYYANGEIWYKAEGIDMYLIKLKKV